MSESKPENMEEETKNAEHINYDWSGIEYFEIIKSIRLGKDWKVTENQNDQYPRPLLINLTNSRDKWNIIKNSEFLKNADIRFKTIGIMPDLTYARE